MGGGFASTSSAVNRPTAARRHNMPEVFPSLILGEGSGPRLLKSLAMPSGLSSHTCFTSQQCWLIGEGNRVLLEVTPEESVAMLLRLSTLGGAQGKGAVSDRERFMWGAQQQTEL